MVAFSFGRGIDDPVRAHAEAIALGARLLKVADGLTASRGHQVYADPAGHPLCLGWGHPDDEAIRRFFREDESARVR